MKMRPTTRLALLYLAFTGAIVGIWAFGYPANFYEAFPGFGRVWVAADGPFNEHLVRDIGAAYLMIGALAGVGLLRPASSALFAIGVGTTLFNAAHFGFHMAHLRVYKPLDQALNVAALGSVVFCSLWLLLPQARARA